MSTNKRKITVLLEDTKFLEFDDFCSQNGFKKSTLINKLIRDFIAKQTDQTGSKLSEQTAK